MPIEVLWSKSKDVKDGLNTKTFFVDIPNNYNAKVSRIYVDADFESCLPIGIATVTVKVNGFNAGTIGTKTFPNYFLDPIDFDVPIKNGINTVEFNVREQGCDKVMIYSDIFYEIAPEQTPVTPPPEFDQCKTCKQLGKLCDGNRCIDNIGKNTVILNKKFIAGAVEGNKPVTHVKLTIDVPIKSGDRIITSDLFVRVNATRVSVNFLDLFYTSLVNVSVNGDRVTSLNLEQDLFVDGKIKADTNSITLKKGRNDVIFDLDFGQAGLQYNVFSDIFIKTEKGDKVNVKVVNVEEYGTGGVKPIDIGLGLLPIVLGLGVVILLSTSGGRTVIYKGAKAGFNKVKNR